MKNKNRTRLYVYEKISHSCSNERKHASHYLIKKIKYYYKDLESRVLIICGEN